MIMDDKVRLIDANDYRKCGLCGTRYEIEFD